MVFDPAAHSTHPWLQALYQRGARKGAPAWLTPQNPRPASAAGPLAAASGAPVPRFKAAQNTREQIGTADCAQQTHPQLATKTTNSNGALCRSTGAMARMLPLRTGGGQRRVFTLGERGGWPGRARTNSPCCAGRRDGQL